MVPPVIAPFNATAPKLTKVWSPVFIPEILLIVVAWADVIPPFAVFNAIAESWSVCSVSIAEIPMEFAAMPDIPWSPVFVLEVLPRTVTWASVT